MRIHNALVRPSWTKLLLALVLFGTYFSAYVQSFAFREIGPKPALYDLLSPLGLWPASILMFFPVHVASGTISGDWPQGSEVLAPFIAAGIYSLVLAWLFMFAHERGGVRVYRPGRLALPFIPVAILFVLAHTWPESMAFSGASLALSGVLFTALAAALYIYMLFCLARSLGRSAWWMALWTRLRA